MEIPVKWAKVEIGKLLRSFLFRFERTIDTDSLYFKLSRGKIEINDVYWQSHHVPF